MPNFLHECFAESDQAELAGIISGTAGKRVFTGQAADVDDPATVFL